MKQMLNENDIEQVVGGTVVVSADKMKIGFTTPIEFKVVDELPPSERDAKGFGSSDKKREEQNNG